jgi:hypothetical protein
MNHASFLGFAGIAGVLHPRARDDFGLGSVVAHGLAHRPAVLGIEPLRRVGAALIVLGLLPLLSSFVRFAWDGLGTPAPIAPPTNLVVTGFYRRVRNPSRRDLQYPQVRACVVEPARIVGLVIRVRVVTDVGGRFGGIARAAAAHDDEFRAIGRPLER